MKIQANNDAEPLERCESLLELPGLEGSGRPVVIVGGEDDPLKRERLSRRSRVKIEWVGCEEGERISRRVREGHVSGLIILDGLAGHSRLASLIEATRQKEVPIQYANRGGLSSIANALLRIEAQLARSGGG